MLCLALATDTVKHKKDTFTEINQEFRRKALRVGIYTTLQFYLILLYYTNKICIYILKILLLFHEYSM